MLYCVSVGVVLQDVLLPNGGTHRPWKKLSGVRFSWKITMMCRKLEICPYAKEVRIATNALRQRFLTTNLMATSIPTADWCRDTPGKAAQLVNNRNFTNY